MEMSETGEVVYQRTYSRTKPDGNKETWPETVERVVDGNLALGDPRHELPGERDDLIRMMTEFKVIPAGRHLWASGVKGAPHLFNCWVAPWGEDPLEHFRFTFLRLMEGGGVGANYSNRYLSHYPAFSGVYDVHIVCSPDHPDYEKMLRAGVLSPEFDAEWPGAFPVEDSREGWAEALCELLRAYYDGAAHTDRVFDVSRVRGEGSRLKTFGGRASGPLPLGRMLHEVARVMDCKRVPVPNGLDATPRYKITPKRLSGLEAMEIDHAIATCVVSGGNRRSARMSIMRWDDPQIEEFIRVKADGGHWTTNVSVEVDGKFWTWVGWPGDAYDYAETSRLARAVLRAIADGMLTNGEPGFWNSSLSNEGEPNRVSCTNPCGEIVLEEREPCNLGHVNLGAFVHEGCPADFADLELAHRLMTRFLIRATNAPVSDPGSAAVLARNRRIGVGHLGVATFLAKQGRRYSSAPFDWLFRETLGDLYAVVDSAGAEYAHALRIPVPVKMTTVAPTGTIAKLPGVSEGIHPIFAKYFIRRIRFSDVDEDQRATVESYRAAGYRVEPCVYAPDTSVVAIPTMDSLLLEVYDEDVVESAADLTVRDMLSFQAMYQECWSDNAVSYTVNVDPDRYTAGELADILAEFGPLLKGATVFPELGMPQSPYERLTREEFDRMTESGAWDVEDSVDENCVNGCPVR